MYYTIKKWLFEDASTKEFYHKIKVIFNLIYKHFIFLRKELLEL